MSVASLEATVKKHQVRDRNTVKVLDNLITHFKLDNTSAPEGLTLAQANDLLTQLDSVKATVAAPIDDE